MLSVIRNMVTRHAWMRFAIVGVAATVIHYGVYYLLLVCGIAYIPAYAAGFVVSLAFNLIATGRFTFPTKITGRKAVLFTLSHIFNFLLHIGLLRLYVKAMHIDPRIAPVFVYLIAVPVNYLLVRTAMRDKKRDAV